MSCNSMNCKILALAVSKILEIYLDVIQKMRYICIEINNDTNIR